LILLPDGLLRICCHASQHIKKRGNPMSVYDYPIEEIWNSDHFRSVRRNMLEGKRVPDCAHCYQLEKTSESSYRILSNVRWSEELGSSFKELVDESKSRDFAVPQLPIYLQFVLGNLCNLKCRMCSPLFSSQIEKDDVHRHWLPKLTGEFAELIDWTEDQVTIGPQFKQGVETTGIYSLEIHKNRPIRWTNGDATFRLSVPSHLRARSLLLQIVGYYSYNHHLRVEVNEHQLYDDIITGNPFQQEFDIPEIEQEIPLTIRLSSDRFKNENDPRDLGVAVETLKISLEEKKHEENSFSYQFPVKPWFEDGSWIFKQLLKNPDRLRGLYFTGGEPMIQKQVAEIINYLLDRQVANNITLEFSTNCTVLKDSMLKKLDSFRKLFFGLSIDAYGSYNEYIRCPAKWDMISKNVSKLLQLSSKKFTVHAVPVLQVYNILNVVDLLKFFDHTGVRYLISLITEPWFLAIGVLPARARQIAADRLRAYSKTELCGTSREHVLSIANQIESVPDDCNPKSLRTLMLFTNDLDATRGQNFRDIHNELLNIIQETGFHWTEERRFRELGEDRVAWVKCMEALSQELRRSEAERIVLTKHTEGLSEQLKISEDDRAARLEIINNLVQQFKYKYGILPGSLITSLSHRWKSIKAKARQKRDDSP